MEDLGSTGHRKTSSGDKAAILAPYPTAWFRVSDRPFVVGRIVKLRTRQARQRTEIAALPPRSFPSGVSLGPSLGLPPLPCPCCYSLPPPFFKCL